MPSYLARVELRHPQNTQHAAHTRPYNSAKTKAELKPGEAKRTVSGCCLY